MSRTEKYTTSRLLRAITAAAEDFSLSLVVVNDSLTSKTDIRQHINIRRYVAKNMRTYDEFGLRASFAEIGRVLHITDKAAIRLADTEREAKYQSHLAEMNARAVVCNRIICHICHKLDIEQSRINSNGRRLSVVFARRLIVLMCRRHTSASYPEITRAMGRTTHSTTIAAMKSIECAIRETPEMEVLGRPLSGWVAQLDGEVMHMLAERKVAG